MSTAAYKAKQAAWWREFLHQPRRVWFRRALFQVHLWSGLIVGLLATVAGVTGSAIVYREALDRRLAPELYRVQAGPAISADALLEGVRKSLPGYKVQSLDIESGAAPWMFRLTSPAGVNQVAYVDPATGSLLGLRGERQGVMNWLERLHTELLGGKVGIWVNGSGAVGLLLLCLTGIVVWWPGRGRVWRAVRIHRPGRWRRFNWDLHTAGGFWISLPLAVEAFTGIFLCFGLGWLLVLFGGRKNEFDEFATSPKVAVPCAIPRDSLASILDRTNRLHPEAEDMFVLLPETVGGSVTIFGRTAKQLQTGGLTVTAFDACSGALMKDVDSRGASTALRAVLFLDAFHFGLVGGDVTRVTWVLLGLTPGGLFVTGFLLWWRRVVGPALRMRRPGSVSRVEQKAVDVQTVGSGR